MTAAKRAGTVMPVTQELLDDAGPPLHEIIRELRLVSSAINHGMAVNRGGGWWRVEGVQVRGKAAMRREVLRQFG